MTRKETVQILAILKAAYPASYNNLTKEEATGIVSVWATQFADMPVDIVAMAIQKAIATNKFPPTIAEVNEKIKAIHWEAYDMSCGALSGIVPEQQRLQYKQIYDATVDYKYGHSHEPKLGLMLNHTKQLGDGNNA